MARTVDLIDQDAITSTPGRIELLSSAYCQDVNRQTISAYKQHQGQLSLPFFWGRGSVKYWLGLWCSAFNCVRWYCV